MGTKTHRVPLFPGGVPTQTQRPAFVITSTHRPTSVPSFPNSRFVLLQAFSQQRRRHTDLRPKKPEKQKKTKAKTHHTPLNHPKITKHISPVPPHAHLPSFTLTNSKKQKILNYRPPVSTLSSNYTFQLLKPPPAIFPLFPLLQAISDRDFFPSFFFKKKNSQLGSTGNRSRFDEIWHTKTGW